MKLTVVGCAGSYPNATSSASCYLVEHDGFGLLLDLGSGALGALAKYRDVDTIDAVALSHTHPDHCADVCGLYVTRRYDPNGVHAPIPLLGPPGVAKRMDEMYGITKPDESMRTAFDFVEYTEPTFQVGPFTVTVAPVRHCVAAYALRIVADGRSLVYSGDTGPCDSLVELAGGADVALFEASNVSTRTNPPDLHMTGKQATQMATGAAVKTLVLTHFAAWNDTAEVMAEAQTEFSGRLIQAKPGLQLEIGDSK